MKALKLVFLGFIISVCCLFYFSRAAATDKLQHSNKTLTGFSEEPVRVLHVPEDYPTISEALQASRRGDIVQVEAGIYQENLSVSPGVSLIGSGWESTSITGQRKGVVVYAGPGSLVEGFTINGSGPGYYDSAIQVSQGEVTVRNIRLSGNSAGLWALCFNPSTCDVRVTVENSIVDGNEFTGINSNEHPVLVLRNNTVTGNFGPAVVLNNAASLAENNLVALNHNDGLVNNVGAAARFNNVWGNARDFLGTSVEDNLSVDPLFRDVENGDYRLRAGSPAIAAGTPAGTDLGALDFEPVGSPPAELNLTLVDCSKGQVSWSGTDASGYILYYGPSSRQTTTIQEMSTATSATLEEINEASTGYLAVSQYDTSGQESPVKVYTGQSKPCPTAPETLQVGAFPGGRMQLQWKDTSLSEEGFQIERSTGPITGTEYTVVASIPADTELYTETLPTFGDTYWYRLKASNASGPSAYSNPSFSVPFDEVPNQDERYMLVLINEARADPEAYGLSALQPAPPLSYNPLLSYAARSQSQAILNSGFGFGQVDPIGRTPTDRARAVGYVGEVTEILIQGLDGPAWVEGSQNSFLVNENSREEMLCSCYNQAGLGHAFKDAEDHESEAYGQYSVNFSSLPGAIPPNLPSGIAVPYTGTSSTPFTYIVNYYHEQGQAPEQALVYIDGVPHEMSLSSGSEANGTYRFSTELPIREHEYYFFFTFPDGQARLPETGAYSGPVVKGTFLPLVFPGQ